ncbi:MAG: hypothetical protein L0Y58_09920, partial [Verrucomicrobia subdivision 3 bacterium]|nr:hypothetical protein [Limisphaerales bacterium]
MTHPFARTFAARGWTALLVSVCATRLWSADSSSTPAAIHIDAQRVENRISSLLYGQFIEFMFEGIKGGLHAELLRDRGFDLPPNSIGLPRYWERYPDDRNDDYGLKFVSDAEEAYPAAARTKDGMLANRSLRVDIGDGVIVRRGVFQPRVPIRAGVEYRAAIWLKSRDYRGKVRLALESDIEEGTVYAEEVAAADVTTGWQQYTFALRPAKADPLARFCILFEGRGRVWLDQVSLMPGDAVGEVRRDVFDLTKGLRPAFIRYPGGNVAQDYHWMWGVGPRDERPAWVNLSWKNEPEPSDFGTDEF